MKKYKINSYLYSAVFITALTSSSVYAQTGNDHIQLMQIDSWDYTFSPVTLWVNEDNPAYIFDSVYQLQSSNGSIDTATSHNGNYFIHPDSVGPVVITFSLTPNATADSNNFLQANFTAIKKPVILLSIDTNAFYANHEIKMNMLDGDTGLPADFTRYCIAALPDVFEIFYNDKKVGEIESFTEQEEINRILKAGNTIKFSGYVMMDIPHAMWFGSSTLFFHYKN